MTIPAAIGRMINIRFITDICLWLRID
jgi:hypothetical protein